MVIIKFFYAEKKELRETKEEINRKYAERFFKMSHRKGIVA